MDRAKQLFVKLVLSSFWTFQAEKSAISDRSITLSKSELRARLKKLSHFLQPLLWIANFAENLSVRRRRSLPMVQAK
jgi:hypothetical protein